MAKFSVITVGTSGVDMRQNPLFLGQERAAFAQNLAFDENTIKTRPDIRYVSLGINGVFQGSTYFTPRFGLSATTYTLASTALASIVGGKLFLNPIDSVGVSTIATQIDDTNFEGDTYLHTAESHLVVTNEKSATYWSDGVKLTKSLGIDEDSDDNTHDTMFDVDAKHWLPWYATLGHTSMLVIIYP